MRSAVLAVSLAARVALAIGIAATVAASAFAHAVLVSSSPRDNAVLKGSPKQVMLRFNSRIEKSVTQVTLRDSLGRRIRLSPPTGGYADGPPDRLVIPLPRLKPDSYRLEYRVLATDGHLTPGMIRFTVVKGKAP